MRVGGGEATRIGMLTTYPPMRCGIGDHVHELLPHLVRAGAHVDALTYTDAHRGGPAAPREGITVRPTLTRASPPWRVAGEMRAMLREGAEALAWQTQAYIHPRQFNLAAPMLPRDARLVAFVHDVPMMPRLIHASAFLRRLYHRADALVAHSAITAKALVELHGVEPEKVREMPLGVDRTQFHPGVRSERVRQEAGWAPDDVVVLFLGFVNEGKGVFELLEGFAEASKAEPRLKLVIAGDDVPPGGATRSLGVLDALRTRAKGLGVAERVDFPGFVPGPKVAPWLASADVLALPYHFSYQSAVLFKAMASGAAILATRIEGFERWLRHGETAYLALVRDASALGRALSELARDPGLRERLRHGAAAEAERTHDMAKLAREALDILRAR